MEKKQSSVDWLIQQIRDTFYVAQASEMNKRFESFYEQAKAMHKEQSKKDFISGMEFIPVDPNRYEEDAEQYYNETFNDEKETE